MDWYNKNIYKVANSLIQSLGIKPQTEDFSNVQRYEKQLKQDGSWQKILQTKKQKGLEEAIQLLRGKIDDYSISLDTKKPDVDVSDSSYVSHVGRTSTGGDWYKFDAGYVFPVPDEESIRESTREDIDEDEIREEAYEEMVSEIKQELHKKMTDIYNSPRPPKEQTLFGEEKSEEERAIEKKINELDSLIKSIDNMDEEEFKEFKELDQEHKGSIFFDFDDELREKINQKIEDKIEEQVNYYENIVNHGAKQLNQIACGGNWCISQYGEYAQDYVREGNSFLILRRNGDPRVAIRLQSSDFSDIIEVRFPSNSNANAEPLDFVDLQEVPYLDLDEVFKAIQDLELDDVIDILSEVDEKEDQFSARKIENSGLIQNILLQIEREEDISKVLDIYSEVMNEHSVGFLSKNMFETIKEMIKEDIYGLEHLVDATIEAHEDGRNEVVEKYKELAQNIDEETINTYITGLEILGVDDETYKTTKALNILFPNLQLPQSLQYSWDDIVNTVLNSDTQSSSKAFHFLVQYDYPDIGNVRQQIAQIKANKLYNELQNAQKSDPEYFSKADSLKARNKIKLYNLYDVATADYFINYFNQLFNQLLLNQNLSQTQSTEVNPSYNYNYNPELSNTPNAPSEQALN